MAKKLKKSLFSRKKLIGFLLGFAIIGGIIYFAAKADTVHLTISASWNDAACQGSLVNTTSTADFVTGDNITVTYLNQSVLPIVITSNYGGTEIIPIAPGQSATRTYSNVKGQIALSATPTGSICANVNISGTVISPTTGTLACTLKQADNKWNVTGSFAYGVNDQVSVFVENNLQVTYKGTSGEVNVQTTSSTQSQNVYLRNGASANARIIAQVVCPAAPVTTNPSPTSTSGTPPAQTSTSPTSTASKPSAPKPNTTTTTKTADAAEPTNPDTSLTGSTDADNQNIAALPVKHWYSPSSPVVQAASILAIGSAAWAGVRFDLLSKAKNLFKK